MMVVRRKFLGQCAEVTLLPMKIFCDTPLDEVSRSLLVVGAAAHEIVFAKTVAASVLAKPEVDPALLEAEIAFGQPDLESIARNKHLRWVHVSTAGVTRYDTADFRAMAAARGLIVTNSSSVYAVPCAEHIMSFMLANARWLPHCLSSHAENGAAEWHQLRQSSTSLHRQSVVILGYGTIARELVELLAPFEMQITAMRRRPRGDEGVRTVTAENLSASLATADHVINILPENPESKHFINAPRMGEMKQGAAFYNIGRGSTVDQDALLESLRSCHLSAAWLDVTEPEPLPAEHPLRSEPNCFITPHTAGGHGGEMGTLVRHFLANLNAFNNGGELADRVM